MVNALLVALGGATGALLRYGTMLFIKPLSPAFPTGTLVVNVAGCLVTGLLAGLWGAGTGPGDRLKLLVFTGVLGGFTTFSSFGLEVTDLVREGRWSAAAVYVALSNVLGIGAAMLGMAAWARD